MPLSCRSQCKDLGCGAGVGHEELKMYKAERGEFPVNGTSLVVQWLRFCPPSARGLGLIPDQGTRSHRLRLRVQLPQLKILHAPTKTWHSQINKYFFKKMPCDPVMDVYMAKCDVRVFSKLRW